MLKLTIKQGKPELQTPSQYLKVMKKWQYIITSKTIAHRFYSASKTVGCKIKVKALANNRCKVTRI